MQGHGGWLCARLPRGRRGSDHSAARQRAREGRARHRRGSLTIQHDQVHKALRQVPAASAKIPQPDHQTGCARGPRWPPAQPTSLPLIPAIIVTGNTSRYRAFGRGVFLSYGWLVLRILHASVGMREPDDENAGSEQAADRLPVALVIKGRGYP